MMHTSISCIFYCFLHNGDFRPVSAIPSTVAPVQVYEAHSTPVIHHNTSGDIVPQLNNSDPCNTSNNWNSIVQTATKVLDSK